mmetsp:Transcript_5134/g.8862  ORF Transcript_5134/g.8862 Transcript_5134/m.8862 type:complete len:100 (-) Transcript_5134:895-1194(-)
MAGSGSATNEVPSDLHRRCDLCGDTFHIKGIIQHKRACAKEIAIKNLAPPPPPPPPRPPPDPHQDQNGADDPFDSVEIIDAFVIEASPVPPAGMYFDLP